MDEQAESRSGIANNISPETRRGAIIYGAISNQEVIACGDRLISTERYSEKPTLGCSIPATVSRFRESRPADEPSI